MTTTTNAARDNDERCPDVSINAHDIRRTVAAVVDDHLIGRRDPSIHALNKALEHDILAHPDNAIHRIPDGPRAYVSAHRMRVLAAFHARMVVINELIRRLEDHREAHRHVIERDRINGISYRWTPSTADEVEHLFGLLAGDTYPPEGAA